MHELIELLLPFVLDPVRRAVRAAVRVCSPDQARHLGRSWYQREADSVARLALAGVIRGNSDPARFARTARERLLWDAAVRCERDHMATLTDLHRAGLLTSPVPLCHDDIAHAAVVQPGPGGVAVECANQQLPWLVSAAEAALAASDPAPWRPESDARFWRYLNGNKWIALDLDDPASVLAAVESARKQPEEPLPLAGYFLGFRAAATLVVRDGAIGIAPAGGEERFCTADAFGTEAGFAELAEASREARRQILDQHRPHQGWRFWRPAAPGASLDDLRRRFWEGFLTASDAEDYWRAPSASLPPVERVGLREFLCRAIVGGDPEGATRDFTRGLAFSLIALPPRDEGLRWGQVLTSAEDGHGPQVPSLRIFAAGSVRRLAARRCSQCDHHVVAAAAGARCPRAGCDGAFAHRAIQVCVWHREEGLRREPAAPACPEE